MNCMKSPVADCRELAGRSTRTRPIAVTDEDELEFRFAMEDYKQRSGRLFPTWSEILEVLRSLGYAKRIWKPVGTWASLPPSSTDGHSIDESGGMVGWFATVETPVGP